MARQQIEEIIGKANVPEDIKEGKSFTPGYYLQDGTIIQLRYRNDDGVDILVKKTHIGGYFWLFDWWWVIVLLVIGVAVTII